jgi:hypothetical protein
MSGGSDRPLTLQPVGDDWAAFCDPESGDVCIIPETTSI